MKTFSEHGWRLGQPWHMEMDLCSLKVRHNTAAAAAGRGGFVPVNTQLYEDISAGSPQAPAGPKDPGSSTMQWPEKGFLWVSWMCSLLHTEALRWTRGLHFKFWEQKVIRSFSSYLKHRPTEPILIRKPSGKSSAGAPVTVGQAPGWVSWDLAEGRTCLQGEAAKIVLRVLQARCWLCSALWDSLAVVLYQLERVESVLTDACTASSLFLAVSCVMCLLPNTSLLSQLSVCHMSQPRA
ncbi:PREDICTED: uncharacterized protein LOC108506985 [Lepidothrix coronata]|uniref:Uncharacterized protein LOC108506985 n=1 Tax=Lepidothrix coronata TaxID=321398 RepID=A0A6J0ITS2_9PASS|nr:PREDICTED: uncharacterized protein LOC108506985 [Lepidothrix coronata]